MLCRYLVEKGCFIQIYSIYSQQQHRVKSTLSALLKEEAKNINAFAKGKVVSTENVLISFYQRDSQQNFKFNDTKLVR